MLKDRGQEPERQWISGIWYICTEVLHTKIKGADQLDYRKMQEENTQNDIRASSYRT